jgi:hypothetical protein
MKYRYSHWLFLFPLLLGIGGDTSTASTEDTGAFVPTGEMSTPRSGHTATLLADGRVLIAGGAGESGTPLGSAELYDPATGVFTPAGEMTTGRHGHTATLLTDGKVLIGGGYGPGRSLLASAEVYDPAAGAFTTTGNMITGQVGHTATRLASGKVLIAGGLQGPPWPTAVAAELYDPATGTFASAGNYASVNTMYPPAPGPIWPTATVLPDEKILFVGNNPAELYNPVADRFSLQARTRLRSGESTIEQGLRIPAIDGRE